MKYSDVKDLIAEKVAEYSKQLDKGIALMTKAEEIDYAKNIKLIELRNYQIKCLYDFAKYDNEMPKIQIGDKYIIDRANLVNYLLFENYIKANILYCGTGVSSYLKLIWGWMRDENEYVIRDPLFNNGILYGMKIKSLPNTVIPTDEFVYVDNETDEIIKYKIEGVN